MGTENVPITDATSQELRIPPKESALAMMGFGVVGVMLLDPFDIIFVVAGALVIAPPVFVKTEHWFQRRFPRFHTAGRRRLDRFIDDFERRYPPRAGRPLA